MPRAVRLKLWIAAIAGVWIGQAARLIFARHLLTSHISFALVICCLLLIFLLLWTTPLDAIRLPRWCSEMLILISTIALALARRSAVVDIRVAAVIVLLGTARMTRQSAWWAVLMAWLPL